MDHPVLDALARHKMPLSGSLYLTTLRFGRKIACMQGEAAGGNQTHQLTTLSLGMLETALGNGMLLLAVALSWLALRSERKALPSNVIVSCFQVAVLRAKISGDWPTLGPFELLLSCCKRLESGASIRKSCQAHSIDSEPEAEFHCSRGVVGFGHGLLGKCSHGFQSLSLKKTTKLSRACMSTPPAVSCFPQRTKDLEVKPSNKCPYPGEGGLGPCYPCGPRICDGFPDHSFQVGYGRCDVPGAKCAFSC